MINRITDLKSIAPVLPLELGSKPTQAAGFQDMLREALTRVEGSKSAADQAVNQFLTGDNQDLHTTILATQKASLDFEYLLQMRNKVVQSYQEIMRMQL